MIFYQCPQCKKRWQYPIEKCPDCFSNLEKMSPARVKVVGASEVTIPTVLHPKIPYFVVVLEDEKGNRWVQKSSKEYKIGEELKVPKGKDKSSVATLKVKYDIASDFREIVGLVGGIEIDRTTKILVLPTLIAPKHPYLATNTSPTILNCLLQYFIAEGVRPQNIKVVAQSFDEIPIEASAQKAQLLEVCLKHKITPLDLAKKEFLKKGDDNFVLEVSKEVFDTNLIVNLPALRLGSKLKFKGALENTLKLLKKESYLSLKYLHDEVQIIKKLQEILPEYLTIADATVVQKSTAYTSFAGLMLASFNPFYLDRVFTEIAMIKNLPDYLDEIDIQKIPVIGRAIDELKYDIERVGT